MPGPAGRIQASCGSQDHIPAVLDTFQLCSGSCAAGPFECDAADSLLRKERKRLRKNCPNPVPGVAQAKAMIRVLQRFFNKLLLAEGLFVERINDEENPLSEEEKAKRGHAARKEQFVRKVWRWPVVRSPPSHSGLLIP